MKLRNSVLILATMLISMMINANASVQVPSPLVSTQWLSSNMNNVVLLDVQAKVKKGMKTIDGAVIVNWKEVRAKKSENGMKLIKMLPSKQAFNKFMQKLGVNNNSTIIITSASKDASSTFLGTRLYWQLKYFGHDNVAILNGGNAKWHKEKRSMTASKIPNKGNFIATTERNDMLATTSDVEKAVKSKNSVLVDGREENQYLGLFYKKKYVYDAGHIPGAKNAFGGTFLNHGKVSTFQDAKIIKKIFDAKDITTANNGISYCNSGHMASGIWFMQSEILGNKNFKVYDGSMHAWTKGNKRAVNTIVYE